MGTKDIRNLLLDCRKALRKDDGSFERSVLCQQLDRTIIDIGEAERHLQIAAREQDQQVFAHQVAHAWQGAARELRHTHAALYSDLSQKVLQRLDGRVPDDPVEEIEALRVQLQDREAALASTIAELDSLRAALAAAAPLAEMTCDNEAALAQQRVQALLQAAREAGSRQPPPVAANEDCAPTHASLRPVAEGLRPLTSSEREWCIGEAMVLTNFGRTPNELLSRGDAALAKFVLAAMARYA